MKQKKPVVISFVGRSNSGKTTLIEKIISQYSKRGFLVAVVKSTNHRLSLTDEQKDTAKFLAGGAKGSIITDGSHCILEAKVEKENDPEVLVSQYFSHMDLVIVEGFKKSFLPKVEVIGDSSEKPLFEDGIKDIQFIITDKIYKTDLESYNRNDVDGIINALERFFFIEDN